MAAFSSSFHLFDNNNTSLWLPNPNVLLEHQPNTAFSPFTPQFYHQEKKQEQEPPPPPPAPLNNDQLSILSEANKTTTEIITLKPKRRRAKQGSCTSPFKGVGELKGGRKKQKKMEESKERKRSKDKEKPAVPTGYVHVRARRGQATDSHSLAERVRRERISERMKLLQAIVPGCDKVTGKALMLDEIINYVQSLQNQVEFLSMKLASVNPMLYDFGMDLEPFMVSPDQNTSTHMYPLLDNPISSLGFEQPQILPSAMPQQGHRQVLLWEVEDQRQKIIDQTGTGNPLFSFH